MKKLLSSLSICLLIHAGVYAKNTNTSIKGKVLSAKTEKALVNSTIILNNATFGISDKNGNFEFTKVSGDQVVLKISNVGFQDTVISFRPDYKKKINVIPDIKLKVQTEKLEEVTVKGKAIPMIQKGDTLQYNAAAVKLAANSTAKDLVNALPGMTRDQNNDLHANGKKVQVVMVDDQIFFQDDVDATLEALPADVVQNVQVYDDISELAKFTGFDDGYRSTTLNLVTKFKEMKFGAGDYELGLGTDDRYDFNTKNSFFKGASKFHIGGSLNNVNKTRSMDPLTIQGMTGDNKYGNAKASYSWKGDNGAINTDYDYKWTDNSNLNQNTQTYFNEDRVINSESRTESYSRQHIANLRGDTYIGRKNKLFFTPKFNSSTSTSKAYNSQLHTLNGETVSESNTQTINQSENKSFGGDLKWQTILSKKMYLETKLYTDISEETQDKSTTGKVNGTDMSNLEIWKDNDERVDFSSKLIFMKSKKTGFTLEQKLGYKGEKSVKNNSPLELNYLKNRTTAGFMFKEGMGATFSFDIGYENTRTIDSPMNKDYNSLVGSFIYSKMANMKMMRASYNRTANTPSLYQVYDFFDASTPLQVKLGNPMLKQSYNNNLIVSFNNMKKGFSIMGNLTLAEDYITQNTFISDGSDYKGHQLAKGTSVTEFQNVNGFWTGNVNISYNLPSSLYLHVGYNHSNIPSLYNGKKNTSKQNMASLRLNRITMMPKNLNITFGEEFSYNWSSNSLNDKDSYFFTNKFNIGVNLRDWKKFFLSVNYNYLYDYQPEREEKSQHTNVLNVELGKRFYHDKITLSLKGVDMLDQNKSRTTSFTNAYTQTNINRKLQRYFMVSLKFNFSSLKKGGFTMMKAGPDVIRDTSF
jgi:hypothetical protein